MFGRHVKVENHRPLSPSSVDEVLVNQQTLIRWSFTNLDQDVFFPRIVFPQLFQVSAFEVARDPVTGLFVTLLR